MKTPDYILPLISGVLIAIALNLSLPTWISAMQFLSISLAVLFLVIITKNLSIFRMVFLGASFTSIVFAFYNFFFAINTAIGLSFNLYLLAGLFRSILVTSLFSLLERLTRFLEDRRKQKSNFDYPL
jgi:hypothetical protein